MTRQEQDREAEIYFLSGRYVEFFGYMDRQHREEIERYLVFKLKISDEDAQDCYALAVEAVLKAAKEKGPVVQPIGYIFSAARFNAIDIVQNRKQSRVSALPVCPVPDCSDDIPDREFPDGEENREDYDSVGEPDNFSSIFGEINDQLAIVIVEDAAPSIEIESGWAIVLVREALTYLSKRERQVVELLLHDSDFDFEKNQHVLSSSDLHTKLGITQTTFRKAKSRALQRLRTLIPQIIRNLDIELPHRAEASIFAESWDGPATDIE